MIYHYKLTGYLIVVLCLCVTIATAADKALVPESQVSSQDRTGLILHNDSASVANTAEKQEAIANSDLQPTTATSRSVQIRVLLAEANDDEQYPSWRIMAKNGFVLLNQREPSKAIMFDAEMAVLHNKNGRWYLGDKQIQTDRLLIRPRQGSIMVDGVPYYGSLFVVVESHRLLLINCLDLEDYVFCVTVAEGMPGWSLEMNKVQAIAVRTYAAAMLYKNADKKRLYHIRNTNVHQVYKGKPSSTSVREAVDQTRGIILTYDNKPIIAMYDVCCGGLPPAQMRGVDFKVAPYLARTKACTYCKNSKEYRWQVSYAKKDLETILKGQLPHLGVLRDISVIRKDKAGLVLDVEIVGRGGVFHLKGKKIYSIVKGVRSLCFGIDIGPKRITFKGVGYGHQFGLCQRGAPIMILQGADYRRVLLWTYPGTRFMKIKEKTA